MDKHQKTPSGGSNSSRFYFIAGICCLALMALLWSLDSFFVYTLLGAGAYFLFLGYWKRSGRTTEGNTSFRSGHREANRPPDLFSGMLKNRRKQADAQARPSPPSKGFSGKAVVPYLIFFFASFLFMIILPLVFSDDGNTPD